MRSNSAGLGCAAVAFTLLLSPATRVFAGQDDASRDSWRVTAGAGVMARPQFPGSDSGEVIAVPALDVAYGERWFLNPDGLGAHLAHTDAWTLSMSVAADLLHRDESDAARLRGTGDVDRTAIALLKSRYRLGGVYTALAVGTDLADEGHGTVADLTVHGRAQITPRLALDYGVGGRWINDEHAQTFFGVDAQQSARSGLPVRVAEAGLSELRVFLHGLWAINPHWIVRAGASMSRLQGDAADSPIVEDPRYFMFDAALLYRFGGK